MSSFRRMLLLSSSKVYGSDYLEYAACIIDEFLRKYNVKSIVFIPYAQTDYDGYTNKIRDAFKKFNLKYDVNGIHELGDPVCALQKAEGIFIGGGNTFLLLKTLCDHNLFPTIRERVLKDGAVYIGSSAGTNVATPSIHTTNDMPIIYPPTFDALNLINFNINPHYLDPEPNPVHQGETRVQKIREYHEMPGSKPVVALREGSYLLIDGNSIVLGGKPCVIFYPNCVVEECCPNTNLALTALMKS